MLLVDDDEYVLSALRRGLQDDGYRIFTAPSAFEALKILDQARVGVIVSDQRMPGMSGTELLRQVAATHPDTIRIILSGDSDGATIAQALGDGAIHKFLTKPWEIDSLREEIRMAFWRHAGLQSPY